MRTKYNMIYDWILDPNIKMPLKDVIRTMGEICIQTNYWIRVSYPVTFLVYDHCLVDLGGCLCQKIHSEEFRGKVAHCLRLTLEWFQKKNHMSVYLHKENYGKILIISESRYIIHDCLSFGNVNLLMIIPRSYYTVNIS